MEIREDVIFEFLVLDIRKRGYDFGLKIVNREMMCPILRLRDQEIT